MFAPDIRILVADDAVSMRMTIINHLKSLGFTNFTEAPNGNAAFQMMESAPEPFQLVLSDQNMPECTGLEFLRRVRATEKFKTTPFIMITSETEKAIVVQAVQSGANNYVSKPVTAEALKGKLEATFARLPK